MTEQDKKDLTELLQGSKVFTYSEEVRLFKLRDEIALAALTAQPVNLSSCRTLWYDHDDLSAEVKCIPVKDIKKAIRAAGYEVQE